MGLNKEDEVYDFKTNEFFPKGTVRVFRFYDILNEQPIHITYQHEPDTNKPPRAGESKFDSIVLVDEINSSFSHTNKVVSKETRSIIDQFHLYTTERDALTLYSNYYHDKFYDQDQLKKINEFLDNEYDMLNKEKEVNENEYKTQKDNKRKFKLADKLGM